MKSQSSSSLSFTHACYKCKQQFRDCTEFNACKHHYCQKCFLRTLLKHHMLELPDKDVITIRCKCKEGTCELTLDKIHSIIKTPQDVVILPCNKHNKQIIQTCKECKKHLCETCLTNHNELFQEHRVIPIDELTSVEKSYQLDNEQCTEHFKDYEAYCKQCKVKLCQICLFDNDKHKEHEIIKYETYITKLRSIQQKLQFKTYDAFNEYVTSIENAFDNEYNTSLSNTVSTLENIVKLITTTINEYKRAMEHKRKQKECIMNIIRKVYKRYYDDFKIIDKSNNHICLKFLSKQYEEFSELTFKSEFDVITTRLNEITAQLKNDDINNMINVSYSYFAKRELTLTTQIKNNKTQKQHVNDIIELKDGKLVSACEDNMIYIYNNLGKCITTLKGHINGVKCLCVLPSNRFASGSADKTIRIWDTKTFKTLQTLKQHNDPVIALSLLDEDKLATCSLRQIIIYDHKLKATYFVSQQTNWVRCCVQLNKTQLVSCCDDGSVVVYDKFCRLLNSYKVHGDIVLALCRLRDGRLVSGDKGGKIVVWDKDLKKYKIVLQHYGGILCIKQLKDGRIVTASMDQTVRLWDLDFKVLNVYKEHQANVNSVVALKDGGFASGGSDCLINVWK